MEKLSIVLGLMSGTSLDGVDLALCSFREGEEKWVYEILASECIPYKKDWIEKLTGANTLPGYELLKLDKEYGSYLGELILAFVEKCPVKPEMIASHGHTIFHNPSDCISFQLGNGASIVAITGIKVICDFRSLDVCLGGQGAPLVPIGDQLLFSEYDYCLNLGGIANISYSMNGKRIAYDICPCNILLNYYANKMGMPYDKDGMLAGKGEINEDLTNQLNNWSYYYQTPPKSLDKDALCKELIPGIDSFGLNVTDILATLTHHIAEMVNNVVLIRDTDDARTRILITGGGALNNRLTDKIAENKRVKYVIPDEQIINFKEALIFAFLGLLRAGGRINTLSSVTGAKRNSSGGAIY